MKARGLCDAHYNRLHHAGLKPELPIRSLAGRNRLNFVTIRSYQKDTMKRIFLLVSLACALAGGVRADDDDATIRMYLHNSGYNNLSDADLAKVHAYLKTNGYEHIGQVDPSLALNSSSVASSGTHRSIASTTISFSPAPIGPREKPVLDQIISIKRAFDMEKRPGDSRQVLKNAGYNLAAKELDAIDGFIRDYGWYRVIGTFREDELALVRFRYQSTGSATEINQNILSLFAVGDELASNQVGPFIDHLILRKYGLVN
jgi:hypothetical protein